ncbi:MAG: ycfH [Chthoniobacteraceae bacterium]|nr:ycfH [Chthoniobacteraceae bacterium]
MLTDTHAHLDFPEFTADFHEVLARAGMAGVNRMITIGTSVEGSRRAVALAEAFPNVYAAIGVHPNSAMECEDDFIDELRELARSPRVVAIGEIGIDYHRLPGQAMMTPQPVWLAEMPLNDPFEPSAAVRDGAIKARQAIVFEQQLDLAVELGLNVVIHERDAWEETIEQLAPYEGKLRAVFHCFGKTIDQARHLLGMNHLVSFTGIVTFKNSATVQETAALLPDHSFMVETDCPFLAPVPNRGKRCEPAHTRLVAEKLAQVRGTSLELIAAQTEATANNFFRFQV